MKGTLSRNPKPDVRLGVYTRAARLDKNREALLDEIREISVRVGYPKGRPIPDRAGLQYSIHVTDEEAAGWIRNQSITIARRRSVLRFEEFIENAGLDAYRIEVEEGISLADENFDVRAAGLAKAKLAMDAYARLEQSKHDAMAIPFSNSDGGDEEATGFFRNRKEGKSAKQPPTVKKKNQKSMDESVQGKCDDLMASIAVEASYLPERERAVIEATLEGLDQKEAAMLLGVSQPTVSRLYNRALAGLIEKLRTL